MTLQQARKQVVDLVHPYVKDTPGATIYCTVEHKLADEKETLTVYVSVSAPLFADRELPTKQLFNTGHLSGSSLTQLRLLLQTMLQITFQPQPIESFEIAA